MAVEAARFERLSPRLEWRRGVVTGLAGAVADKLVCDAVNGEGPNPAVN